MANRDKGNEPEGVKNMMPKAPIQSRLRGWIGFATFTMLFGLLFTGAVIAVVKLSMKVISWVM
jgi:hypothetical protein